MSVVITGAAELQAALSGLSSEAAKKIEPAMRMATLLVHREAINNAPRSPTVAQLFALRKTTRKVRKNPRATSRPKPGGLRRSIEWDSKGTEGEVFVAANSEAGKYAAKMHDDRYKSWRFLGPGSLALGERVREKFIERAVDDNEDKVHAILAKGLQEVAL